MDSRSSFGNTITPLRENRRRYSQHSLLSPRSSRLVKNSYCVSDTSVFNSKKNDYSPGPLLTPTSYHTNVSTYIDSKSPGLSGRIVQYNRDAAVKSEPFVSHQAKYGSPGLFPIVHLEKKSIPIRRLPRESVTVRLVSAHEFSNYSRNNGVQHDSESPDVSTSSVLKALREISKKRVLSEDVILPQNKRQKNNCHTVVAEIHSIVNTSPNNNISKSSKKFDDIPCVVDALAASLTSSNTLLVNSRNLVKRKVSQPNLDVSPPKNLKHASIEVETQTESVKVSHNNQTTEEPNFVSETATNSNATVDTHFKPYESVLRNKLAGKLDTFRGEDLTSILSSPDKPKHNKHVTFNVPDVVEKSDVENVAPTPVTAVLSTAAVQSLPTEISAFSTIIADPVPQAITTQSDVTTTSSSISYSPSIATTNLQLSFSPSTVATSTLSLPVSIESKLSYNNPQVASPATTEFLPVSNLFGTTTALPITTSTIFSPVSNNEPKTFEDKFKTTTTTPIATAFPSHRDQKALTEMPFGFNSPSKPGGFKFDLQNSSSHGIAPVNSTATLTKVDSSFTFGKSNLGSNVNFGANTKVTSAFGTSSISSTGFESKPISTDGILVLKEPTSVTPVKPTINFPVVTSSQLPTGMELFNFGGKSESTVLLPQQTNLFSFGPVATTTTAPSSFLSSVPVTSVQASSNLNSFKFGASAVTAPSAFPVPPFTTTDISNNDFKFGSSTFNPGVMKESKQSSNGMPSFKFTAATTAPSFMTSTFNAVQPSNETSAFQFASANNSVAAVPLPSDSSLFKFAGSTTNNAGSSLFNFGGSTTTNAPALQANDSNAFKFSNSNTNAVPGVLNGLSTFKFSGTSTNAAAVQPLSEANTFKFGNSITGSSVVHPTLDSNTFKFNASSTTPSTKASVFTKSAFNLPSQTQNEQNIFNFGGSLVTTAAVPVFNAPAFNFTSPADTSTSAVAAPPPPSFPTTTAGFNQFNSFESKSVNPFNSSSFRDVKTPASFGVESKPNSVFGAPTQNENVFGSFKSTNQANVFGVSAPPTQTSFVASVPPTQSAHTQPFQFGASNAQTNIFTFGANAEPTTQLPATGMFSFNAATTNNPFGSAPAPTFGALAPTNNFGMQPPNFGSTIQGAPMFSIGTGSTTPKPRTQLKARRRT